MRYFAYGTNMNPAVLEQKGLPFSTRQRAVLHDYALRFNKRSLRPRLPSEVGFANIEQRPGEHVEGVLYDMPDSALERLDRLERCPDHYARIRVELEIEAGTIEAFTYAAQPDKVADGLLPSRNYINHILAARAFLSDDYVRRLERLRTYAGECAVCHGDTSVLFVREGEQLFVLCTPCIEARDRWGVAYGRELTVLESEAVMRHVRGSSAGYSSIGELIDDAIARGLVPPRETR